MPMRLEIWVRLMTEQVTVLWTSVAPFSLRVLGLEPGPHAYQPRALPQATSPAQPLPALRHYESMTENGLVTESAAGVTKLPNSEVMNTEQQQHRREFRKGRKRSMNLLQALVRRTLIIVSTLQSAVERSAQVWEEAAPSGTRSFVSAWPGKQMNQPFFSRLKNPWCVFPLFVSLLCIRLNTHLRLNGCRITLHVKYSF